MLNSVYVLMIVLTTGQTVTLGTYQSAYECDKQGSFYKINGSAGELGRVSDYKCIQTKV